MVVRLEHKQFHQVTGLYAQGTNFLGRAEGALNDPASHLFVNDADHPTVALLCPKRDNICLIAGECDRQAIRDLVEHAVAAPGACPDPIMFCAATRQLEDLIVSEFGPAIGPIPAVSYRFGHSQLQWIRSWSERVPTGCTLRQIDAALAVQMTQVDPSFPGLWPDAQEFASQGVGFCLFQQDRPVSVAYSAFAPRKMLEMAVATVPDSRGRGLSPLTCCPLIEHCLEHEIAPFWTTLAWNTASRAVARKLGFTNEMPHHWLKWTPFHAMRRMVNVDTAALAEYAGRYLRGDAPTDFRLQDDGLIFVDETGQELALGTLDAKRFFVRVFEIEFEFVRDASGRVNGVIRRQGGREFRLERG